MKYSLLPFFLTFGIAASAGAWAGSETAEVNEGPTQEEYEAALIIVQKYMAEENRKAAAENTEEVSQDGAGIDETSEVEESRVITNAGFSVFGSGQIDAASITAFSADGNDGVLRVGNPDTNNEALSGRLVFHESLLFSSFYWGDLCGFQFIHNGDRNTLELKGDCQSKLGVPHPKKAQSLVVYDRDPGEPIMFNRSLGIGGKLFNGGGTGTTTGGGFLMMSYHANGTLSCDNVCQNHDMTCDHSLQYGAGVPTPVYSKPCSDTPSGDFIWAMCACAN